MKAIMYHYVREARVDLPHFRFLHIDDFKQQLDYFSDNFGFVTKTAFEHFLKTGAVPSGVLLTFDDGLRDHYDFVFPELLRRNIWAIFFVSSAPLQHHRLLNVHRIHFLLGRFHSETLYKELCKYLQQELSEILPDNIYATQTSAWHEKAVKYFFNYYCAPQQTEQALGYLLKQLNIDEANLSYQFYMNTDQLRAMRTQGMTIQAHSQTHTLLTKLTAESACAEITHSVQTLQQLDLSDEPLGFCYPYGGKDSYDTNHIDCLTQLDISYGFAVESKDIDQNVHKLALPRYDCNEFPYGISTIGKK